MTIEKPGRGRSGFTLIEMLVVLALLMILMLLGMPQLFTAMRQAKLRGIAQETVGLMRQARLDAVKYSAQAVVRIVPPAGGQPGRVEAFSDRDSDGKLTAATEPILGRVELPRGVSFLAPPNSTDKDSVDGLTIDPADSSLPHVVIFQRDGSVTDVGSFRFGDQVKNFVEVRVEPAATARIEVLKCRACTDATDHTDWYASGDGGEAWKWN
ncbi:MAG TPA: prepilin-type N-terminal cleavage/methylation domain-containing protein [Thermoanaerobaculia bacterium]|nr:prepilin-type N-terminal cleavage/methylation domain-containing protein [Thermoanaerobaculia bacterium]